MRPLFLIPLILILFSGCAVFHPPAVRNALSLHELTTILSMIQDQEDRVFSFYSSGTLLVQQWSWESEADILIAGIKKPLKLKIEITHPWGQPLLHILIDKDRLEILSYQENRLYQGTFSPEILSRFFPVGLDPELIWAVLRGYPHLIKHHRMTSPDAHSISLLNENDRDIEVIGFHPESFLPKTVLFPDQYIDLIYLGFQESEGIYYAKEVRVRSTKNNRKLILKKRAMVFNSIIPKQIFTMRKPTMFETVDLDKDHDDITPDLF